VSVFLEQLEYYPSTISLTTNRLGEFDPAFQSRIHLTIGYSDLDERQRAEIWKYNLTQACNGTIPKDMSMDEVAKGFSRDLPNLNGRQIKNIISLVRTVVNSGQNITLIEAIRVLHSMNEGGQRWRQSSNNLTRQLPAIPIPASPLLTKSEIEEKIDALQLSVPTRHENLSLQDTTKIGSGSRERNTSRHGEKRIVRLGFKRSTNILFVIPNINQPGTT